MKTFIFIVILLLVFLVISINSTRSVNFDFDLSKETINENKEDSALVPNDEDTNLNFTQETELLDESTQSSSIVSEDMEIKKESDAINTTSYPEILQEIARNIQRIERTSKRFLNDGYSPELLTVARLFRYGYLLDDLSNDFDIQLTSDEKEYLIKVIIKKELTDLELEELNKLIPAKKDGDYIYYEFIQEK